MLTLLTLLSCAEAPETEPLTLDEAFRAASETHDVPKDVLVAIAYSMTRFDEPQEGDHEHGGLRGAGVMDIAAGAPKHGPDVARGAARRGVDVSDVMHDRALNIDVAASELRWYADQLAAEGATFEREEDWVDVVGWYSGSDDAGAQRSFAKQVYRWIEDGLRAKVDDGWITIRSRELDLPMLDLEPVMASGGDSGLVDNVVAAASCNYTAGSRTGSSIDTIVVHTAQGSYSGTYNWFQNCDASASAHYVIRSSDGEITQMVGEEDTAWHAGDSSTNSRSVSIELEGYIEDPDRWYTDAMYRSLAKLIVDVADRQGVALDRTHVIGHREVPGCSYSGGGGRNCHTDPGTDFDWDYLMDLVAAEAGGSGSGSGSSGSGSSGSGSSGSGSSGSSGGVSAGTGDLIGYVRKDSIYNTAGAVAGATVRLGTGEAATTDSTGLFRFYDIPAGVATLTVTASGYNTATDPADVYADQTNWNSVAVTSSSSGSGSSGSSSAASAPSNLDPTGWERVYGDSVTLSWSNTGASSYEVRIYWWDGSDWRSYYTYTTSSTSKTFWPTRVTDYAFLVRSTRSGSTSEWSAASYFSFEG
jgi:hypothetical protein